MKTKYRLKQYVWVRAQINEVPTGTRFISTTRGYVHARNVRPNINERKLARFWLDSKDIASLPYGRGKRWGSFDKLCDLLGIK